MSLFPNSGSRTYRLMRLLMGRQIRQFEHSTQDPKSAQESVLRAICSNMSDTTFGRSHQISTIRNFDDFRQQIPMREYQEFDEWMHPTIQGQSKVFTRERVTGFVETSGTQAAPKLIPVTSSWSRHIRNAQMLWVLALLRDFPSMTNGAILHHVSSATERFTDGGLPIGANTGRMVDALPSSFQRRFVLNGLSEVSDGDQRMYMHLRVALERPVTAWLTANPSTIALYARKFLEWESWLRQDLAQGTMRMGPASNLPSEIREQIESKLTVRPQPLEWSLATIWPLRVLGCWTGGPAQFFTQSLPELLGAEVPIRDVGITASEGYFALPLQSDWDGGVLWTQGEILEFEDDQGTLYWSWELGVGKQYSLITSGRNGLVRYRMNDLVEVTGFYQQTPIIRFVGKAGRYLNATGEKVTEDQLTMAVGRLNLPIVGFTGFIEWLETPRIQVATEWDCDVIDLVSASHALEQHLQSISNEYASKRKSNRLQSLTILSVPKGTYERFRNLRVQEGASDAQVKDCVIAKSDEEWHRIVGG